jgi:multimeric flavodoxin WrbA
VNRPARLLLVYGGHAGGRTDRLRAAAVEGIAAAAAEALAADGTVVELRERRALDATVDDLLWAGGVLLGTPEHFGYMSGALKDFFDRTFYPAEGRKEALPVALFVSAGNDGRGTVSAVERIVSGYRWNWVVPPLIVVGEPDAQVIATARELGATVAAGLAAGMF